MIEGVNDQQWRVISVLAFALYMLFPIVIIGLYVKQYKESGIIGLIGFVLAALGAVINSCMLFDMAFVWPILSIHAPELIDFSGPLFRASIFSVAHNLIVYLGTIGFIVFGIAMIRAKVFPRFGAVLFTIGMPLTGVILFPPFILRAIGSILAGASLFWKGIILIKGKLNEERSA